MSKTKRPNTKGLTVDSATSRDLDDAIWVEKADDVWKIQVSITDVSDSIPKESRDDYKAFQRAFTRYYATGNYPMLPRYLADRELSLLPNERRSTITFNFTLARDLRVTDLTITPTQLRSKAKMSHKDVDQILDDETHKNHGWWVACFELAQSLLNKRRELGALVVFDLKKGLMTNEDGEITKMPSGQFYRAYLIVQELMILTNHAVTAHLRDQGISLLFRNHTTRQEDVRDHYLQAMSELLIEPTTDRLDQLSQECRHIMNRARYQGKCEGHFALNLDAYAHWTSPIRRYADLVNHRVLHAWLAGMEMPYSLDELEAIGNHLNKVSDDMRDGTSDSFKSKQVNMLSNAGKDKLVKLPEGDFRYFLEKLADETLPMNQQRAEAVIARITDHSVGIADIARVIFADITGNHLWYRVKEAALQWLRSNPNETFSMYNLAHVLRGLPELEKLSFDQKRTGASHQPQFHASVKLTHVGREYQSDTCTAARFKDAKLHAVLSLIEQIAEVPLKKKGEKKVSTTGSSVAANPKGHLFEVCQKHFIKFPTFEMSRSGAPHAPTFTATATLKHQGKIYTSEPCSANCKKQAEKLASADLLTKLPQDWLQQESSPTAMLTTNYARNPIGALQEWCQQNRLSSPEYSFERSGTDNAPVFACTCSLTVNGDDKEWKGISMQKKAAKADAALSACKDLL